MATIELACAAPARRLTIDYRHASTFANTRALRPSSLLLALARRHEIHVPSGPVSPTRAPRPPGHRGVEESPVFLPATSRNRGVATIRNCSPCTDVGTR